ncbi:MAG: hypothetical protein ACI4IS_02760 [Acutalibacteraceae bacterium]
MQDNKNQNIKATHLNDNKEKMPNLYPEELPSHNHKLGHGVIVDVVLNEINPSRTQSSFKNNGSLV